MKEAREDCAAWEDVDIDTFIRFSKFAYTGDYDDPEPRVVVHCSDETSTGESELPFSNVSTTSLYTEDSYDGWESSASGKGEASGWSEPDYTISPLPYSIELRPRTGKLWQDFAERYSSNTGRYYNPRHNGEDEDYTDVFLSHARMAVFADYHGISGLETLALKKLTSILASMMVFETRVGDIAHLVSYVYENTIQLSNSPCGLRELVSRYSACQMEAFWQSAEFKKVFETYSDFSKDLTDQLLKRLE
jgi:hypothetical protein